MKRTLLLPLLLLLFPVLLSAEPDTTVVDSQVKNVTVFRDGAQVTRNMEASLSSGRHVLQFKGLAPTLKRRTLQLSGEGDFMILSLTHRQDYLEEHPRKQQIQHLIATRDSLNQLIENKNTTRQILDNELDILRSNSNIKGDQQNISAAELEKAMDFFHRKLTEIKTERLKLKREVSSLKKELEKVQKQIAELNDDAQSNRSVVTAVLQSESAGEVNLSLTYLVPDAGWYPSYDLRVTDINSPVQLSYKANIRQNTGIDWNNVRLTVSSSIPDQRGTLPDLQPWYVRIRQPEPAAMRADVQDQLKTRQAAGAEAEKTQMESVPVKQIQNQTSFSYQVDVAYNVPSGSKPLTVTIDNHEIPADYRYYTVPKRRKQAYLTARVSDWNQYNLLPGDANLFFENTYVGQSTIDPQTVGDTLSFSLGRDESIVVERTQLEEYEEKNFFGNKIRERFAWEISLRNTKDQPVNIEVHDQFPVSQHEDINVELKEKSGAEVDRQTGMLSWQLQIEAGENRSLRFVYEMEYPKGKEIKY